MINQTLNLTNATVQIGADICKGNGAYTPECLYKWFCPQINHYFTSYALGIIIAYVVVSWLLWALWRFGWNKINWTKIMAENPITVRILGGSPFDYETKVRVELWVRDKIEKIMIGFLAVFWWFSRQ